MNNKDSLEEILLKLFQADDSNATVWVAYSGGMDSSVLLHALNTCKSKLNQTIAAIHVNHQLQSCSDDMQRHCEITCHQLEIHLEKVQLDSSPTKGESVEAWARENRYQAFSAVCNKGDYVLTAQHQDDQAETFLLQLMRGAGLEGLSAMPSIKENANYKLVRPFLDIPRSQIEQYAIQKNIKWIDDPSNNDERYDRNFIRNKVLPLLKTRWTSASKTISRSSSLISEASNHFNIHNYKLLGLITHGYDSLIIDHLQNLTRFELSNILRMWIKNNNFNLPSQAILEQIINNVLYCKEDKMPLVHWQNVDVRRYKNKLYIMTAPREEQEIEMNWDLNKTIQLSLGTLSSTLEKGSGIRKDLLENNTVQIKRRQGGEIIQPFNRQHNHELKKLFQESNVLPWVRDKIPLIYSNEELIAVAGFWVSNKYACSPLEEGWNITWDTHLRLIA